LIIASLWHTDTLYAFDSRNFAIFNALFHQAAVVSSGCRCFIRLPLFHQSAAICKSGRLYGSWLQLHTPQTQNGVYKKKIDQCSRSIQYTQIQNPMLTHAAFMKVRKNLPSLASYYLSRDEAIEQGGVLAEFIVTKENKVVYGVFPTQEQLRSSAYAYMDAKLKTLNLPFEATHAIVSLAHLLKTHTHLSDRECLMYQLPNDDGCKWFDNETGALTAFTLKDASARYMVKLRRIHDAVLKEHYDKPQASNDVKTCGSFYGVFNHAKDWDKHRKTFSKMTLLYYEPEFPFKVGSLEYDRCRCTLMGVKNALHVAPVLNPIPSAEVVAWGFPFVNPAHCFRTEEDALKMAGVTVRWNNPVGVVPFVCYAVYATTEFAEAVLAMRSEMVLTNFSSEAFQRTEEEFKVISVPEDYGVLDYFRDYDYEGGWNPRKIPRWK
jgi:hypothetical protein